jgi:hypothetical protein
MNGFLCWHIKGNIFSLKKSKNLLGGCPQAIGHMGAAR